MKWFMSDERRNHYEAGWGTDCESETLAYIAEERHISVYDRHSPFEGSIKIDVYDWKRRAPVITANGQVVPSVATALQQLETECHGVKGEPFVCPWHITAPTEPEVCGTVLFVLKARWELEPYYTISRVQDQRSIELDVYHEGCHRRIYISGTSIVDEEWEHEPRIRYSISTDAAMRFRRYEGGVDVYTGLLNKIVSVLTQDGRMNAEGLALVRRELAPFLIECPMQI